jgi:hypothetical protein
MLSPGSVGVSGVAIGVVASVFACSLIASATTSRLIVTRDGLISWHNLKRRRLSWTEIKSFEVGGPRQLLPWPGLVVHADQGRIRLDSVVGPRGFVERIIGELELFRRKYDACG